MTTPTRIRIVTLAAALAVFCCAADAAVIVPRPFVSQHYLLLLDRVFAGNPAAVEGGAIAGQVTEYVAGDGCYVLKVPGAPTYEDVHLGFRIPLAPALYSWVGSSLTCEPERRDGLIASLQGRSALWAREFHDALISEIVFPTLDAASKEPAYIQIRIAPEMIRRSTAKPGPQPISSKKAWLPSNFRVSLPGLDTTSIVKVEFGPVKREIEEYREGGSSGVVRKIPGRLEFPNLVVTLPAAKAASWIQWHEDSVVSGNGGSANEKEGLIELLSHNLQDAVARILLHGVGVLEVEPVTGEPGIPMARVVLYCQSLEYEQP